VERAALTPAGKEVSGADGRPTAGSAEPGGSDHGRPVGRKRTLAATPLNLDCALRRDVTNVNEHVLEEAGDRHERLTVGQLVTLIERHDREGPGVSPELVREYAEELDERGAPVYPEKVYDAIDDRLAEEGSPSGPVSWTGSTTLFSVGEDRVSAFPEAWHEEFPVGGASMREIVEFGLREPGAMSGDADGGAAATDQDAAEADRGVTHDDTETGAAVDDVQPDHDEGTAVDEGADSEDQVTGEDNVGDTSGSEDAAESGGDETATGADVDGDDEGGEESADPASGGAGSDPASEGPHGVPRQVVLNAATLFGDMEWPEAQGKLETLRGEGVVVEDLDQHPNPNVRLADDEGDDAADRVQER
jgi:hypothetical protein